MKSTSHHQPSSRGPGGIASNRCAPRSLRGLARELSLGLTLGLALAAAAPAGAEETPPPASAASAEGPGLQWSWSAFGSIGYAQAGQDVRYLRHIDRNGTLSRDSLFGAQVDVQITPQWSATLQGKLAPSTRQDSAWDLTTAWAFAAWRPGNDWLLRAGKLRAPVFLRSEHLDVGQTYDEARLPTEIYAMAPANDFTGANAARSLAFDQGDLTLEAYYGKAGLTKRFWLREGLPPQFPAGTLFMPFDTALWGLAATWREPRLTGRVGLHYARTTFTGSEPGLVRPVFVPLGPGLGYWQTSNQQPGPGVETTDRIDNLVLSLGAEARLDEGWRVAGEYVHVKQRRTELGVGGFGAYLSVYRALGAFTPYLSVSTVRSDDATVDWMRRLDSTTLPSALPGADLLNAGMRAAADVTPVYRQRTVALGSSWAPVPNHKLKAEWSQARIKASQLLDLRAGEKIEQDRSVDVWSLSYHFVF